MLRLERPRDLDVLIIYQNRSDVVALRAMNLWEATVPALDIIAMTPDEERDYDFIKATGARCLYPQPINFG